MIRILIPRRTAAGLAWILGATLAGAAGWLAVGLGPGDEPGARNRGGEAVVVRAEPRPIAGDALDLDHDAVGDGPESEGRPSRDPGRDDGARDVPGSEPEPPAGAREGTRERVPVPAPPTSPRPEPPVPPTSPRPAPPTSPRPEPPPVPPEPEPAIEQPTEVVADAASRAKRADRMAEVGEAEGARLEAAGLLGEYGSFSGLVTALVEDGVDEVRARLSALRVLQVAGHESIARDVARELKRSYTGTAEVLEAIRRWRILTPRITRLDSSIENGEQILVEGTLENPDIGEIRRVLVQVEALDAAENVVSTTRTRVRPKNLAPGVDGSFTVRLEDVDPASVLRTRASVVEWESEVLKPR